MVLTLVDITTLSMPNVRTQFCMYNTHDFLCALCKWPKHCQKMKHARQMCTAAFRSVLWVSLRLTQSPDLAERCHRRPVDGGLGVIQEAAACMK